MRRLLVLTLIPLILSTLVLETGCSRKKPVGKEKDYTHQIGDDQIGLREVDMATLPSIPAGDRQAARTAIAASLEFMGRKGSAGWFPQANISHDEIVHSLKTMDQVLATTTSDGEFDAAVKSQFRAFMSVGCDDQGTVLFTGYYTPIIPASRSRTETFRFPLYKRPADLVPGPTVNAIASQKLANGETRPYPSANEIADGDLLKGQELVWLNDAYDAYLVRVQGSARLRLTDGSTMDIGFSATNGHPYQGIGQALVKDGKIAHNRLSFFTMREYFRSHPQEVAKYTRKNPRFVFFAESKEGIRGCLNTPVTSDATIATDKSIFPPAGPVVVQTHLANGGEDAGATAKPEKPLNYVGLRIDQDRGGAIRAPGRSDLYMGVGETNERRAGGQYAEGKMWYLIAR